MTVTCPTCKAALTIPDDRLPKGRAVSAACPHCKGKIVIDLTAPGSAPGAVGGAVPAPDAAPEEAPASYGEQRQPLALVCVE
jgi:DNA-directed RNA polymerase subunit RPC12/RpoP